MSRRSSVVPSISTHSLLLGRVSVVGARLSPRRIAGQVPDCLYVSCPTRARKERLTLEVPLATLLARVAGHTRSLTGAGR